MLEEDLYGNIRHCFGLILVSVLNPYFIAIEIRLSLHKLLEPIG